MMGKNCMSGKFFPLPSARRGGGGFGGALPRRSVQGSRRCVGALILGFLLVVLSSAARAGVTVIGHESWALVDGFDKTLVSKIFTGRTVQFAGISVQPVNMRSGNAARAVFFREILRQTDDEYVAYWIVRRAIGKGVPPAEMNSVEEMVEFVRSNPGAVGYIDAPHIPPGIKTLLTLP